MKKFHLAMPVKSPIPAALMLILIWAHFFAPSLHAQEPRAIKDALFAELEERLTQAQAQNLELLAPENLAKAQELYQSALGAFEAGERLQNIRAALEQATLHLDAAFESASRAAVELQELIAIRQPVAKLNAAFFASREFAEAETAFKEAVRQVELGDSGGATAIAEAAQEQYRTAAIAALAGGILAEATTKLENSIGSLPELQQEQARAEIRGAQEILESSRGTSFEVAALSDEIHARVLTVIDILDATLTGPDDQPPSPPPAASAQPALYAIPFGAHGRASEVGIAISKESPNAELAFQFLNSVQQEFKSRHLSDLTLQDIYLDQDRRLVFKIANRGSEFERPGKGDLAIFVNERIEARIPFDELADQSFREADGSSEVKTNISIKALARVRIELDSENEIRESNESNNSLSTILGLPQDTTSRFGGALVRDERTNLPSQITDMKAIPRFLSESENHLSASNAEQAFKSFLSENADYLGVDTSAIELVSAKEMGEEWYVKYRQTYQGLPVYKTTVGMSANAEGEIHSFSSNYAPDIDAPTTPRRELEAAVEIARDTYETEEAQILRAKDAALIIYPERLASEVVYHLAWKFLMSGEKSSPFLDKHFIVDAISGAILRQVDAFIPQTVKGKVRGQIYPVNPTTPAIATRDLAHAYVDVSGGSQVTSNKQGSYSSSVSSTGQHTVTFKLDGPYAKVEDDNNGAYRTKVSGSTTGSTNQTWNAADRDHINVFYHTNWIHDWYKAQLGYSWKSDKQMLATVNVRKKGAVWNNAEADGNSMNFGANNFARSSDVIYHEYTHNVIHDIFGGWAGFDDGRFKEGYAFDEGFADYFACSATNSPSIGEGAFAARNLSNNIQYSTPAGYTREGHDGGRIIAGAAWDLRASFTGAKAADKFVLQALYHMSTKSSPYYFSRPDKSNFLASVRATAKSIKGAGAPKAWRINQAFRNHNLLPVDLYVRDRTGDQGNVPSNTGGLAIDNSPDIRIDAQPYQAGGDEEPIPGQVNKVHVTIRNSGYLTATGLLAYVQLYYKSPKTSGWNLIATKSLGNDLAANGTRDLIFDWKPSEVKKTFLLAKVQSTQDWITDDWNVALDNNVAQKKIRDLRPPVISNLKTDEEICVKACGNKSVTKLGGYVGIIYYTIVDIEADITDVVSGLDRAELWYRYCPTGGICGPWKLLKPVTHLGWYHHWELGNFEKIGYVEYYIKARDKAGRVTQTATKKMTVTDKCEKCSYSFNHIETYSIGPIRFLDLPDPPWTQFERLFNAKVNLMVVPGHDYSDRAAALFATGTPPDILFIDANRLATWAEMGLLEHLQPLDSFVESNPELMSEYSGELLQSYTFSVARPPLTARGN